MKSLLFAKRNSKEILRDPINIFFGLGFPLILLLLLAAINSAIPVEANNSMFSIEKIAPGIATFGTTFFALFAGMLLAKDRTTSFLMRLFASPMSAMDFIIGYTLPLIVMAAVQVVITFGVAGLWIAWTVSLFQYFTCCFRHSSHCHSVCRTGTAMWKLIERQGSKRNLRSTTHKYCRLVLRRVDSS